jgi:prefoldin subunit 5
MDSERITDPKTKSDFSNNKNIRSCRRVKKNISMTLEFEEALKVLEEHIEVLKQDLLFLMAECKPEMKMMNQRIITIKRELDKAIQERMKLNQILASS